MSFALAHPRAGQAQGAAGPALTTGREARAPAVATASIGAWPAGPAGDDGRAWTRASGPGPRVVTDERRRSAPGATSVARS
jgi:hypothetical protein